MLVLTKCVFVIVYFLCLFYVKKKMVKNTIIPKEIIEFEYKPFIISYI